jgi:hypothetical protein
MWGKKSLWKVCTKSAMSQNYPEPEKGPLLVFTQSPEGTPDQTIAFLLQSPGARLSPQWGEFHWEQGSKKLEMGPESLGARSDQVA